MRSPAPTGVIHHPDRPLRESSILPDTPVSWAVGELARATGGQLVAGAPDTQLGQVRIDSRLVQPGDAFLALRGSTHGSDYAASALERGAATIIVGSDAPEDAIEPLARSGACLLQYDVDSLLVLGRVARAWRRLCGFVVVGITGSSGKTSTKDLLAQVLSARARVVASAANQNNEIGVPLTLLGASEATQVVICEMGMRGIGQIDYLCSVAEPDVGIVTNVGSAHIELLGSRDNILRAKSEMVAAVAPDGVAIVPRDQPDIATVGCAQVPAGMARPQCLAFDGEDTDVREWQLAVDGPHQRANLAAALLAAKAACARLGMDPPSPRAEPLTVARGRGQKVAGVGGSTLIDDSYNANPESMRAALSSLVRTAGTRRIAVLGHMAELGEHADEEHRALGSFMSDLDPPVDMLVVVASHSSAGEILRGYVGGATAHEVGDCAEASRLLRTELREGDVVLVKASRSAGLEGVVADLAESDQRMRRGPT